MAALTEKRLLPRSRARRRSAAYQVIIVLVLGLMYVKTLMRPTIPVLSVPVLRLPLTLPRYTQFSRCPPTYALPAPGEEENAVTAFKRDVFASGLIRKSGCRSTRAPRGRFLRPHDLIAAFRQPAHWTSTCYLRILYKRALSSKDGLMPRYL